MPQDYGKQIADAVQAVRREEGKFPLPEEEASKRIESRLQDKFMESVKASGTEPVPHDLYMLREWAYREYCLVVLRKLRYEDAKREHEAGEAPHPFGQEFFA
jgi:hypothetical protein